MIDPNSNDAEIGRALRPVPRKHWDQLVTRISWCHAVWNLWTGCSHVSSGCAHCYAETWASRWGRDLWGDKERRRSKTWGKIPKLRWMAADSEARDWLGLAPGERLRVFVGSLMDWAEGRPEQDAMLADAWPIIQAAPELDFLLLTKRPQNIPRLLPKNWGQGYGNVWLMTSIESGASTCKDRVTREPVIARAARLLEVPAAVHGISYEPAVGSLATELEPFLSPRRHAVANLDRELVDGTTRGGYVKVGAEWQPLPGRAVSWVIYGGESGPQYRPEGTADNPKAWARAMRDICRRHGVAFFHKQSAAPTNEQGVELDGEVLHELPEPRGRIVA